MKKITTVQQYGRYEIIGPVKLPLKIINGKISIDFSIWYFEFPKGRYAVLTKGKLKNVRSVLARVESICIWGHTFGSQYCDCQWQLEEAKRRIAAAKNGIIIFACDEHGKSVGLKNHFLVYAEGLKRKLEYVVDAYKDLGLDVDYRTDYADAADILNHFGIKSITLMSNNPQRISLLKKEKIKITRMPLEAPLTKYNQIELFAKKTKAGHLLKLSKPSS